MTKTELPPYTGYRPRSMRLGRNRHEGDRGTKRSRLGNRLDRGFYKNCKSHLRNPDRWSKLCLKANRAVYNRDTVAGALV